MTARRALALTVVAALALRLALMLLRGDYMVYDEAYYLLLARSLRQHHAFALNGLPHVSLSPLQPLVVALGASAGLPDLWLSRGLAALCGALLVVPVASLARRLAGERAGVAAGLLTAASPALMTFLPFFPGESWNLYFGSEPLFLLAAFGACAAAARAADAGAPRWFAFTGVLAGAAFLTRGEGVVLGPVVFAVLGGRLLAARAGRPQWRGWLLGVGCAVLVATPYLAYLRATLGRWAFSGRVQAAAQGEAPVASARAGAQRGGTVLEDFVWGGDQARFRAELYRLTPDASRMQSQYWGVDRHPPAVVAPPRAVPADTATDQAAQRPRPRFVTLLARGVATVLPVWFGALALIGFALASHSRRELVWLAPPLVTALVPVAAAYVEPRVLLPLVPVAAIGAALAWHALKERLEHQRPAAARAADVALAVLALLVVLPTLAQAVRSAGGATPLQQLASAQRRIGTRLGAELRSDAVVMSWHPALAVWAERDWRVLPEEPIERVLPYAQARGVTAVVLSRFNPSPLADPPRPFSVFLLDASSSVAPVDGRLRVEPVETTPDLFVGRLAPEPR